jgi:hypothetical protein
MLFLKDFGHVRKRKSVGLFCMPLCATAPNAELAD